MNDLHFRIAAGAGVVQAVEVILPALGLVGAQFVQVIPGIEAGVVAIVKNQLNRVATYRFDGGNPDIDLACLQGFLAAAVTAHFR